jgi:CO dehydrogenase/acetyl-CoA synthase alpha subunit
MIGLAITLLEPKRTTKQIQHIKGKLVRRLGITKENIYHWRKNEFGMINGEHSHIVMLIGCDNPSIALEDAKRVIHDIIQRMGLTVYLDTTRKLKTK